MPKILITVNDEAGQHRGYCTQLQIPEILTIAGAPLPCYPVEDNRTLRVRMGSQYITIAVYEHPGDGPDDSVCLSIEQLASMLNHLRASGWDLVEIHPDLLAQWADSRPFTAPDLEPFLSPWNALKSPETA
jgi:hypothetical protein